MPRAQWVFLEGGIFHVYNRTSRGERVFAFEAAASAFVERLREVKARDGLHVVAWCLMANHYDLAVRCGPVPSSAQGRRPLPGRPGAAPAGRPP